MSASTRSSSGGPEGAREDSEVEVSLKTGARAGLLLPSACDRLMAYRQALEARFGKQPANALVFQVLSTQGPLWYDDGFPGRVVGGPLLPLDGTGVAPRAKGGGQGARHAA